MTSLRVGTLRPEDKQAFLDTSRRLGLDPYEFGALVHKESSFNPNIIGGAGNKYKGLIQFSPESRSEVGLPNRQMTISEQLPYVEKYLQNRGYKPGMGIDKAYATVLGGNPNVSLNAKDSFGTSVAGVLPSFQKNGSLYKLAQGTLGDIINPAQASPNTSANVNQQTRGRDTYNFYLDDPKSFLGMFRSTRFGDIPGITDMFKSPDTAFDKDKLTKQLIAVLGGDKTYYGGGETYYG